MVQSGRGSEVLGLCFHALTPLNFQLALYLGLFIISHVLTGTSHYKKQFSSPKKEEKSVCISARLPLASAEPPHSHRPCHAPLTLHGKGDITSPGYFPSTFLLFSPLQEGFREYIQKDVFVPPPWVSVPRLPIKLSHKSSIIGSKT